MKQEGGGLVSGSGKSGRGPCVAAAFHRMNFLLQVSQQYALVSNELSRYCFSQVREISRKKLARVGPESRRLWCKRCNTHMVSGVTCDVSLEERKIAYNNGEACFQTNVLSVCNYCNCKKRHSYRVVIGNEDEKV